MELPMRKDARLKNYNYSSNGAYFLTLCVKDRHEILWDDASVGAACGRPSSGLILSEIGKTIVAEINKIEEIYGTVKIDKYVIMPNHVHMIISLCGTMDEDGRPQAAPTISRIINKFKGSITKQIGYSIWQKLFYDHVIRNETEYQKICQYTEENPMKWAEDKYNRNNV